MDALTLTILVIGCIAAGAVAGWFARAARRDDDTALLTRLAASEAAQGALREQLATQEQRHREAQEAVRHEQQASQERERRDATILTALAPVRETLTQMQQAVQTIERDRQQQYGALGAQLRRAQETDETLRGLTESLVGALRSNTARGVWGETQLRRVVEAAGLTRHVDFDIQTTVHTDDGRTARPDMLIRLPGGKSIAVDAKAPLDSYLTASAATDEDERRAHVRRHVKAVRAHVDALAKREYWSALPSSPEFVICFLPGEALLSAALEEDPTLLEYAFSRRVALASPVSLWAVLKTVAYTWTQDEVSTQARELFDLGNQLYQRLGSLAEHADGLRKGIERTVESYNRFVGSLESRVLVTARRFPGIDATKLDALSSPPPVGAMPRPFSASELTEAGAGAGAGVQATSAAAPDAERVSSVVGQLAPDDATDDAAPMHADALGLFADLGEVRQRITGGSPMDD